MKTDKYNFDRIVLGKQIFLLHRFARSLTYFREIRKRIGCNKSSIKNSWFWTETLNSHLKMSVIDWCIIFGTDDNDIHWKKATIGHTGEFQNNFRLIIYEKTCLNKQEYQEYHKELIDFRNKYVAHVDMSHTEPVPIMDNALKVAITYDEFIRKELKVVCIQDDPKPISESVADIRNEVIEVLNKYDKQPRLAQA